MAYLGRPASPDVSVTGSTDTFIGNGGTTFTLSRPVKDSNASLLEVFVSNVQQQPSVTYSVASSTLTFVTAPGVGEPIYVTYRDYNVAPVFTVPDGAITDVKLANDAATEAKIGTGAVTETKIGAGAVTETKIADGAVTPNKISGEVPVTKGGTGTASLTANAVLLGNGTSAVATVSAGDTGNVLTSDGTRWISKAGSSGGSSVQIFTSPGLFTIPTGVTNVKVTVIGGGGNGSTITGSNPGAFTFSGGGGGAGGTAVKWLSGLTGGRTLDVTVGSISNASSVSSNTETISNITATGGVSVASNVNIGGGGGVGSGGDINIVGGSGGDAYGATPNLSGSGGGSSGQPGSVGGAYFDGSSDRRSNVAGGYGFLGGSGGRSTHALVSASPITIANSHANGIPALGFGCGGGGATKSTSPVLNPFTAPGGSGNAGVVVFEW